MSFDFSPPCLKMTKKNRCRFESLHLTSLGTWTFDDVVDVVALVVVVAAVVVVVVVAVVVAAFVFHF